MTIGELCTREVVIITEEQPVLEAARRMREHHVGDLVVVREGESGNVPVGVLTDRDLVVTVLARDVDHLTQLMVGDVVSGELVSAREEEPLDAVLGRMRRSGVRRVPVVDARQTLVGIFTADDLLEWISEELSGLAGLVTGQRTLESRHRA